MRSRPPPTLLPILLPLLLAACGTPPRSAATGATPEGAQATLALLETTDLHANVLGYDYYKLAADPSSGLERTATLIRQARAEFPNTLLLDNGDTIQGTALADYQALAAPVPCGQALAIHKAMNLLGVDGAGLGNHDFDYGLPFLNQVTGSRLDVDGVDGAQPRCAGPAFPIVLANVYSKKSGKPLFQPYAIIDKRVTATGPDGKPFETVLKVGIIGLVTPMIMNWNRKALEGRVYTEGVREAAQKYIPQMRARGADLVVAISHGGLDGGPYSQGMEDGSWHLAQVPGIDAMLTGHAHQAFPNASSAAPQHNLPGVDKVKGTVHGVPTVMASQWGKHLGVIGLRLRREGGRWMVDRDRTTVEVRALQRADKSHVAADPSIAPLVAAEHEATMRYVRTPVGRTEFRMTTYFADVGDVSAIQIVNQAQAAYLAQYVKANLPRYASLPVLSMSAPFKSGAAGPGDYTDVKAGDLALYNAADLYLYPNALYGVKIDGAGLKAWLEKAAERFNTIDPALTAPQELVNSAFAGYNFDMLSSPDVSYRIDLTRPPGKRVQGLSYRGREVADGQEFLVATNNYRASGGGGFPGLDGGKTIFAAPDASRDVMIAYIRQARTLSRERNGGARSWRFASVKTRGPVVFHSAPGQLAVAREAGLDHVSELRSDDGGGKGYALYAVDLSQ
ncbi:bifunctional 2',3'-cyclic-nucleotide 2'-phosphodiesterase/3'-nucleotidase [Pseudoduganella namucuonensis]|uniref:2',3'-cyclic-nucleotide 2'-phosphodiesterase / 3'-nucleotidase n=1 Tax=Pseudoduganella namucuonensis TaxID=1035707 RepID=A0A1I7L4L4_9BURK|nr:bifunctional 2',3'-cyclic-nucleotide 2'-phosphodiesterase/3'-nucleotidase [Pseudoduganella namucuonensis]SFV04585.1 2',3'-cyclic-nucleotide 2'-phosphodiesterase / 3'-nucleotidase [Pseudoduganella namucuonensis]